MVENTATISLMLNFFFFFPYKDWGCSLELYVRGAGCPMRYHLSSVFNTLLWKTCTCLQRETRGLSELHGLPVGNLSSRRQTLLSKVSVPKNLLERHSCQGDKIGAMVLAVCSVPYWNGRGQRVVHSYFLTFVLEGGKCHWLTYKCTLCSVGVCVSLNFSDTCV